MKTAISYILTKINTAISYVLTKTNAAISYTLIKTNTAVSYILTKTNTAISTGGWRKYYQVRDIILSFLPFGHLRMHLVTLQGQP
jgi:hypothetical protein